MNHALNIISIIKKKRDGKSLSFAELDFFVSELLEDRIENYQASALLMAALLRGLSNEETVDLTRAMIASGIRYDFSDIPGSKIDKHSTGGVGDKVSLILAPLVACFGVVVPMMSGRGLGHTAGTLDKLESIPGMKVNFSPSRVRSILKKHSFCMIGQGTDIAPADRRLYALRDVTGTVESPPLITASILSKKIAEGTKGLVIDLKVGAGAFMKTFSEAQQLGSLLKFVGNKLGLNVKVVFTLMDEPLGYAVGHSLEMIESLELMGADCQFLKEHCPAASSRDLRTLTLHLAGEILVMARKAKTPAIGISMADAMLRSGKVLMKMRELVRAQGGDGSFITNPKKFRLATNRLAVRASTKGFVSDIDGERIGLLVASLGGGRLRVTDEIDHSVGIIMGKKTGDPVRLNEILATVFFDSKARARSVEQEFRDCVSISSRVPCEKRLILGKL